MDALKSSGCDVSDAARAGSCRNFPSLSTGFLRIAAGPMKLSSFETMDPHLLVGLVNTELRNHSSSLDDLCKTHGIDEKSLQEALAAAGYHFNEEAGQFR